MYSPSVVEQGLFTRPAVRTRLLLVQSLRGGVGTIHQAKSQTEFAVDLAELKLHQYSESSKSDFYMSLMNIRNWSRYTVK